MRRKKQADPLIYGGPRNDLSWKFRNGVHFLAKTDSMGFIESVAGVVSPVADGSYVGCCQNRFGTYSVFDTLEKAKIHVIAVIALEGDSKHDIS
jgi:hypothetical protein